MTQRKRYSAEFKFQVALDAAKGLKTLNDLSSAHGVHSNQISQWKQELLNSGPTLFSLQAADLFVEFRLQMELAWLKKKSARYS
jgi:transposase